MLWGLALLALWAWPSAHGEWTQPLCVRGVAQRRADADAEVAALPASNPSACFTALQMQPLLAFESTQHERIYFLKTQVLDKSALERVSLCSALLISHTLCAQQCN